MITVEKLTRYYGTVAAIDNISFEVEKGEILGLLGPNGAGKSTTMKILTGFLPPSDGHASVAGFDVVDDSMAVRQRVGYMPEHVPIYPDMTVEAYIKFWAKLRGMKHPAERVTEVLAQFQLLDRRKKLVRSLSKGLTQRLGLAQAIVHNPEVIILDEPTIGIDPAQVIEVRDFVQSLRGQHTVLFSSHILSEVEQVCDRVVILNQGKIVAAGTAETLRQQLHPGTQLYVEFDPESLPDDIQMFLANIPGVQDVQPYQTGYLLISTKNDDIRAIASKRIAQQELTLLEMRPMTLTLEDIFLDIVEKD